MIPSRSEFLPARGGRLHLRHWGRAGAPPLFMLHGWMDVSASFQFVVDCLRGDWHVIAPDWRGFGLSDASGADTYWFPDYLADLDALLEHCAPAAAVNLLGHSMGGNVACLYAGVRPRRVRRLINLEGFGLPPAAPAQAPGRYAEWLDGLRAPPALRPYADRAAVAARLQKTNRRLTDARADFLSRHWAAPDAAGQWRILADPRHKRVNPVLYRVEEAMACWRAITAPMLWLEGADSATARWLNGSAEGRGELERRLACLADLTSHTLADAGHMLHHDQPEALAPIIEAFLE